MKLGELWNPDDPRLAPAGDLDAVVALLEAYEPRDAHQETERERMLAFAAAHPDALHRSCLEGHFTGAAVLLDASGERVLLTHHRKLRKWLQLGGHCDGDGNLAGVALREAIEESGVEGLLIDPRPIDLDVHAIPARPARGDRPAEPRHLHLDVRFLVHAPPGATPVASEESLELGWFAPEDLAGIEVDDSVGRLFRIVFGG